jgi:hypothetical protein
VRLARVIAREPQWDGPARYAKVDRPGCEFIRYAADSATLAWIERQIVAIADGQRGLITTAQLVELGLTQQAIQRRVQLGRLTRIYDGVFAVGRFRLGNRARWKAATLAAGEGALLACVGCTRPIVPAWIGSRSRPSSSPVSTSRAWFRRARWSAQ